MNHETFLNDLNAVRDRAGRFRRQAGDTVSVAVGRDRAGTVQELRWLLWPPPEAALGPVSAATAAALAAGPPAAGPPPLDDLAATLHEVVAREVIADRTLRAGDRPEG